MGGHIVFFTTVVRIINISGCWYHWCNLSTKEGLEEYHTKGMLSIIYLIKNL